MKQPYEKATAELVVFDNADVITTSGKKYCIHEEHNSFENAFD